MIHNLNFNVADFLLAVATFLLAFFRAGIAEWFIHAKLLHADGGVARGDHVEHHEVHSKTEFQGQHEDEDYDANPRVVAIVAFGLALFDLCIGFWFFQAVVPAIVTFGTVYLYFYWFEVVHRRVHSPVAGGWFEGTALYRHLKRVHQVHHARGDRNFCIILPSVDRIFRTFHQPAAAKQVASVS